MVEPEIAFADLADDADLAEEFLKYVFRAVLDERADDMDVLRRADRQRGGAAAWRTSWRPSFERMEYTEAIDVLEQAGRAFEFPVTLGHRPAVGARALPERGARRSGR